MRQGAQGWCTGMPCGIGWGGRWEGGSGWGIHVYPWLIHVNVWQNLLQDSKVISLQLKQIIFFKKKNPWNRLLHGNQRKGQKREMRVFSGKMQLQAEKSERGKRVHILSIY